MSAPREAWRRNAPTAQVGGGRAARLCGGAPFPALVFAAAFALTEILGGAACYDPKIESGNLHCHQPENSCPDGFVCAAGVCVSPNDAGAVADHPASDAPACTTPVAALCTPAAGVATGVCDPVCQTGCACGQRCSVGSTGPVCLGQGGLKTAGQICSPSTDDCAPGYACLREACGASLGRCYRFCRDASMCGAGVGCATSVNSGNNMALGQLACDLAEQTCEPLATTSAATGCPDPALSCFVNAMGHTLCDCPSGRSRREGESCRGYDDCAPGLACLDSTCLRLCHSTADCGGCQALGNIHYCPPAR